MQGSGIHRQAGLISKLEGGGGGDDTIQALAALLRYPLNRRLDGSQSWAGDRTDETTSCQCQESNPDFSVESKIK